MTNAYKWVQWNRHKKAYDLAIGGVCVAYVGAFVGVGVALFPPPNEVAPPILLMRALGSLAIILLHVILCIGPLARLSDVFAPLLYNRRHLGVTFFLVSLVHAFAAIGFYGGFGDRDPFSALIAGYGAIGSLAAFPFEVFGFVALLIFFVMAATSHDFWLARLSPRVWKTLHMLVYVAYGFVVIHVALGPLQAEQHPALAALLIAGVLAVSVLHLAAAVVDGRRSSSQAAEVSGGWIDACAVDGIEDGTACTVRAPGGHAIAVFRDGDAFTAMSSVCAHQGGPLGEGRIVNGCVTCPWHGYQYRPEDGTSPPPYTEKLATFNVRITNDRVLVDPTPNEPGTKTTPACVVRDGSDDDA